MPVEHQEHAAARIAHLNSILRAIRNVNQLIARERDRQRLIQGICDQLTDNRGYVHAWLGLIDARQRVTTVAEAGFGEAFRPLLVELLRGDSSPCVRELFETPGETVTLDPARCQGCPLAGSSSGVHALAARLEYEGRLYGVLVATVAEAFARDPEERTLFTEAAADVAFALHSLELEELRRRSEQDLELERARLEALLQLSQMTQAPLQEITDFALEEAVRLTQSRIGYLAFMNDDESVLTMHSWSKTAMAQCSTTDKRLVYPIETTGLWGEAVRQRQPVITNDYAAPNPLKKGYPEGHVPVLRHMNVPVFDGDRIVAVSGVGNKDQPYDQSDVRQLTLLMQGMWRLIQNQRAQQSLRTAHEELERRVLLRTADLAAANEELKLERYLLNMLMDQLPHCIYFKDAQSRFIRINRALAKAFRLEDPDQAVGRQDADFFSPAHAEQAWRDEQSILRSGLPLIDQEEQETWPDGRVNWVLTTKMPLGGGRGVARRQGGGRGGQSGQERLSGEHEPRNPHAAERRHRHDGTGAGYVPGHAAAGIPDHRQGLRRDLAGGDQRHPGFLQDRSGQAGLGDHDL